MARLAVRVRPGAKRTGMRGWHDDGTLRVEVVEPPEGGRANHAVVAVLARALGIHRSGVTLVGGASSRIKWVDVPGLEEAEMRKRIDQCVAREGVARGE